jgi:hypothetical protein
VKKNRTTIIILFSVLTASLLFYFIYNNENSKRYQWYESYKASSDQPYGTLFARQLLESYRPGGSFVFNDKKPLRDLLPDDNIKKNSVYIFIGQSLYLTEEDSKALIHFIEDGGNAFIATLDLPKKVLKNIYYPECNASITLHDNETDSVNLNFYHDSFKKARGYKYTFRYGSDERPYSWRFVSDSVFCDSTAILIPLGHQSSGHVNFLKIPAGKGNLYIHSNPLVFTNYFLANANKTEYAASVFSHLEGKHIVWDEYSKLPFAGNTNAYNSPLYYVLQQPSLKYAWWLLLVTVILYILFFAKRQQRVIPVLEPKTNTSLEFVNLISTLHYQNGNHLDMARKKMKYFQYFVRSKYGIHADTFKQDQINTLAEKAKVNVSDLEIIFRQYAVIEQKFQHGMDANRLLDLYNAIENFYRNAK